MSSEINPEAAQPSTIQSFEMSNRNPPVANWGETNGGQIAAPAGTESRVTPEGAPVSSDAGLKY